MGNYRFRQAYLYGDDWDGELTNIPEDAVFYCYDKLCETQQEWYIVMLNKDYKEENDVDCHEWSTQFDGVGCAQVKYYNLLELRIIHLDNIKPYGEWPDVGEDKFNEIFHEFFNNTYAVERTSGKYEIEEVSIEELGSLIEGPMYKMVEEPRISACYRLKGLSSNATVDCTQVVVYDPLRRKECYGIIESCLELYLLEKWAYDPLKLKREVTHSCLDYENTFNTVVEKLR